LRGDASELNRRDRARDRRDQYRWLAILFLLMPVLALVVGRGVATALSGLLVTAVGAAMLVWQRRHPVPPEHYAAVERLDDRYQAWCDCLWEGDWHTDEASARNEARTHTPHVRDGLHKWGS
jgi:hypothetical protein